MASPLGKLCGGGLRKETARSHVESLLKGDRASDYVLTCGARLLPLKGRGIGNQLQEGLMKTNTIHPNQIRRIFTSAIPLATLVDCIVDSAQHKHIQAAAEAELARRYRAGEIDPQEVNLIGDGDTYRIAFLLAMNPAH